MWYVRVQIINSVEKIYNILVILATNRTKVCENVGVCLLNTYFRPAVALKSTAMATVDNSVRFVGGRGLNTNINEVETHCE